MKDQATQPQAAVEAEINRLRAYYRTYEPHLVGTVTNGKRYILADFGPDNFGEPPVGVAVQPEAARVGETFTYPGTAAHHRETATILAFL